MDFQTAGYLCPDCLATVTPSQIGFDCSACKLFFPLIDRIPMFAGSKDSAYGIMGPTELHHLLHLCQERGWDKGVSAFLSTKSIHDADSWAGYFTPETRAAGRLLLPASSSAKVLDLGCGIGPVSINFARYAGEVVSVDRGLAQLQLLRLRAIEANIRNLRVVCAGDRRHLPFPAESFDVVVLNGVLEWVASTQTGSPRHHQRDFLAEVYRVLKPAGEVYIGIENRFALTYLLGGADEHTGLRFVTVLPRPFASLLSSVKSGQPYRVHTYSRHGYQKLLREAGFAATHFYLPRTNYRKISQLVESEKWFLTAEAFCEKPSIGKVKRSPLKALAFPYLAHSYSIVAGKKQLAPSLIQEAIAKLQSFLANGVSKTAKLQPGLVRIGESSVAIVSLSDKVRAPKFALRIPMTPQASHQQLNNAQFLSGLVAGLAQGSPLKGLLPEPVATLNCQGQSVFAERFCLGYNLRHCHRPEEQSAVFRLGLDFLLLLHRESHKLKTHSATAIKAWFRTREVYLYKTAPSFPQGSLKNLVDDAVASLCAEQLPVVYVHGDFWPGNLLATARGDLLTGVVDWKFADPEGMPLLDLLQLLLYTKGLSSGKGFTQSLVERLLIRQFEDNEKLFVDEYCSELEISDRSVWHLVFMAWLDSVYRGTSIHGHLPSWRQRELNGFLEANLNAPSPLV
jgi:ubiquinone/menaquinone biosynthesis C-methylase UbiE